MANQNQNPKYKANEIYLERIYSAPVKMVWDAWTDPEQVKHWWGPRGFTITTHSKEVKTGGHWDYIMHGPDGKDWPNFTTFLEVTPLKRMVYDHGGNKEQKPMFRVTVNFTELARNKTKMEMWMALPSEEAANATKGFIKQAGGNSTWDRLAEFLEETQTKKDIFVINRTFKTDINTMFDMWTNPEHLKQWLSPTGTNMKFFNVDIKTGGSSFYQMGNDQLTMYGKTSYKEITRPNKIIYTQNFADKDGNLGKHPMAPTWPTYMLTTIEFTEESPSETRVTITWEVFGDATADERAMFHNAKAGMTGGWTGSLDKLEDCLTR